MYGKIINGNIEYAPDYLKRGNIYVFNYNLDGNSDMLIEDGYKIVVDSSAPSEMKKPRKIWEEKDTEIIATWVDDYIEPSIEEQNEIIRITRQNFYQQQTDDLILRKLRKQTLGTWTDEDELDFIEKIKQISKEINENNPYKV